MREFIDEYAGMLVGCTAAALFLSMAAEFALGGTGLYGIILQFAQSIC